MKLQHFSHKHPLQFIGEGSHESDEKAYCLGCGELMTGPRFGCVACGFYLDKKCAEAPIELNHPFHREHSFQLLKSHPYTGKCYCNFCTKTCENFVYHCSSCEIDLHVKCALFSSNLGQERVGDLQCIARVDPLVSSGNHNQEIKEAECFACCRPILDSVYFSLDCGFYLHSKCAELPTKTNHLLHPKHPLILQFSGTRFLCNICQTLTHSWGLIYYCSPCDFALHIECATIPTTINHHFHRKHPLSLQLNIPSEDILPCQICQQTKHNIYVYCCSTCKFALHPECSTTPPIIEDKNHPHPFIPFWRRPHVSFVCDACGTPGKFLSYNCSKCSIMVHKKCISLPHTLDFPMHPEHPIFLTSFLNGQDDENEVEMWECQISHLEEVNSKHARYHCSDCNYNVHVNCAIEDYNWYEFDDWEIDEDLGGDSTILLPYSIITETKHGDNVVATEIKHFSHQHNLTLSNDIKDDMFCDGCVLAISASYYYCSQCDFSLHKSCAELPRKKRLWFHYHPVPFPLTLRGIFKCEDCEYETTGFAYSCAKCNARYCVRCALVSTIPKCEGHQHNLSYHWNYKALCNACGGSTKDAYRCKRCDFNLHGDCLTLPLEARHRFDEHPFKLTYHDDDDYSESHYCDICEEERNPNHWFYHCGTCNSSAHVNCVLGEYQFIKLGSIYTKGKHQHPLTFVQKVHYYLNCIICCKPCLDLALECKEMGCGYIVHWKCVKPKHLQKEDSDDDEDDDDDDDAEEEEEEEEEDDDDDDE